VQDALVTAQSLRGQINEQARREAEMSVREAEMEAARIMADAERRLEERKGALDELERKRARFLKAMRRLLERELDMVSVEEGARRSTTRPSI
jgi:cell division initiation protein